MELGYGPGMWLANITSMEDVFNLGTDKPILEVLIQFFSVTHS
jgi:hypothetical protein